VGDRGRREHAVAHILRRRARLGVDAEWLATSSASPFPEYVTREAVEMAKDLSRLPPPVRTAFLTLVRAGDDCALKGTSESVHSLSAVDNRRVRGAARVMAHAATFSSRERALLVGNFADVHHERPVDVGTNTEVQLRGVHGLIEGGKSCECHPVRCSGGSCAV